MRRRLVLGTVGTVAIGVLLLGLPLAIAVRGLLTNQAFDTLQRQAEQAQVVFNQQGMRTEDRRVLLSDMAEGLDVRFQVFDRVATSTGPTVFRLTGDTRGPVSAPRDLTADLETAVEGEVGRVQHDGLLAVSVPLRIGGVPQVLRAVSSDDPLRAELSGALLSIAGLGVTALGIAGLVGLTMARRLAQPMEDLAAVATRLGEGDFTARASQTGIPESDQVATALGRTADRLGLLVERNRSFGADASHQLRTPLTALRLDLEALEFAGADPALLGAAFTEADRLEATIEELLTLADVPMGDEQLHLAQMVEERLASWVALAAAEDREVRMRMDAVPPVRARSAAIGQCLQVLLDNALEHGEGTITVSVEPVTASSAVPSGWVRLCVTDEGAGFSDSAVPGRGLRLAKSLVQGEGGRISVERSASVCLLLPAATVEPVGGAAR
jgi:signal transduction histidine kinase